MFDNHASQPQGSNDDSHGIDKKHFGELEELGGGSGPDERGGKEEKVEGVRDGLMEARVKTHKRKLPKKGERRKVESRIMIDFGLIS